MAPSLKLSRTTRPSQTLVAARDAFLLDGQARNLTPKTISFYDWQLAKFIAHAAAAGALTLTDLTGDHVRRYLIGLRERRLKGSTLHAAARAIRAWLNWCVAQRWLDISPMAGVTMPKVERDILPALSVADVETVLAAAKNARDRAIILCLLDSGCRAHEFVALDVADVDRRTGQVTVRQGKGRKARTTFFGPAARAELARYLYSRGRLHGDWPLWVSETTGERLTVSGLSNLCKRLGRASGVHVSPHALRRTCALWCHRAGMSLETLRRLLGHSDFTMLRRYLDLDAEDLRAAHEAAPPSARLRESGWH